MTIGKRVFDLSLALPSAMLLLPLMFAIAVWVKLDSDGPVFFRQTRVGRAGQTFRILKFRTMRTASEGQGPQITSEGDPRITRVGAFLRRTKLDELPQLFNVIGGHMSLVGPRPEVPRYVGLYPPEVRDVVLSVRPGITDLAAIKFRNEESLLASSEDPERVYVTDILPAKLELYLRYVETRTLAMDVQLILKTLGSLFGSGAGGRNSS